MAEQGQPSVQVEHKTLAQLVQEMYTKESLGRCPRCGAVLTPYGCANNCANRPQK